MIIRALIVILCCGTSAAQASEPPHYEATYNATALGLTATAYRRQTLTSPQHYTLENGLSLTVLGANVGTVTETSQFRWEDGSVVPLHYEYEQSGLSANSELIDFNWETGIAQSHSNGDTWQLPLVPGALDKLSFSVQIGQDIATQNLEEFSYQVLDEESFEEHLYKITSREVLETAMGKFNTVKIERVRANDSRRRTTVWLATDWDYLLVRLEQVSSTGTETELSIESATMNGEAITGL